MLQRNSQTLDLDTKVEIFRQELGSISDWRKMDAEFDARYAKNEVEVPSTADPMPRRSVSVPPATRIQPAGGSYEVPFAIGRPR